MRMRLGSGPPLPQGSRSGSSYDASLGRELRPLVQTWQNPGECGMEGEDREKAISIPSTTPTSAGRPPATMRPRKRPGPQALRAPRPAGAGVAVVVCAQVWPDPSEQVCEYQTKPLSPVGSGTSFSSWDRTGQRPREECFLTLTLEPEATPCLGPPSQVRGTVTHCHPTLSFPFPSMLTAAHQSPCTEGKGPRRWGRSGGRGCHRKRP